MRAGRGTKIKTLPQPDSGLSTRQIVMKYQRNFAKYFLPNHVYSVQSVFLDVESNTVSGQARVKSHYQPKYGTTVQFSVELAKFRVWRKNIGLYNFIA